MWAAAVVVITAGSRFQGAASPAKAKFAILVHAAASASLWARVVVITHGGGFYGGWRRGAGIRRVLAGLDRVRGFHCNTTLPCGGVSYIAFEPDVALFSPTRAP